MSTNRYLDLLRAATPLREWHLSGLRTINDAVVAINAESSSWAPSAPWIISYRPSQKYASQVRDALLKESGILPRVPLNRIQTTQYRKHSFALLALSDSPAYVACPPRLARAGEFTEGRGLDLLEGLWLAFLHPEVLHERALDLVESVYSIECTPTIYQWAGQRYLSAITPDAQDEMCRPVFVRRESRFSASDLKQPDELKDRLLSFARQVLLDTPMF